MSWTNDFVTMMKGPGDGSTGGTIKLAEMLSPTSCKIGNLTLQKEDLLFADYLLKKNCIQVKEIAPADGGLCTDQSEYLPALKAGDHVAVVQISDSKFFVLGRMVSAS